MTTDNKESIVNEELDHVKELWQKHGTPVVTGICIALAGILVFFVYHGRSARHAQKAAKMFSSSRTIQDLEDVIIQYPEVPSTYLTRLKLAKTYFNSGNYDMALYKYAEFEQKFPDHQMTPIAKLGKIHCMEARGEIQDAALAYENFCIEYPSHYLTAQSIFGHARCMEQLGNYDEARVIYQGFIDTHPDSQWSPTAKEALKYISRQVRQKQPGILPLYQTEPSGS